MCIDVGDLGRDERIGEMTGILADASDAVLVLAIRALEREMPLCGSLPAPFGVGLCRSESGSQRRGCSP